jgi:arsenate reductase
VLRPITPSRFLDRKGLLPVSEKRYSVLFLCTGNSARSILAEAMLNHLGGGRFTAYSAGSHPKGTVHPLALDTLQRQGLSTSGLRSKNWEECTRPGAPPIDFIFTLCDDAVTGPCPIWPGHPVTAHWGLPDPAAVDGDDATRRRAFGETFRQLHERLASFTQLPDEALEQLLAHTSTK